MVGDVGIISLRAHLVVTNPGDRAGVIVVRAQIGRAGWTLNRTLQECHFCDVAGERVSPRSPGALIGSRTTAMMQISQPFEVEQLPTEKRKNFEFHVVLTDQLGCRHTKRMKLHRFTGRATQRA
jgi:hypothetical protein